MTDFKVGNWVKGYHSVGRVEEINEGKLTIQYLNGICYIGEEVFFCSATVLDYIRTLNAEKVAGIFTNIYLNGQVVRDLSTITEVVGEGACFCSDVFELLNQPLTDEIVKQLGGKE